MGLIISLVTMLANLFLGISVFRSNPRSASHRLFSLLTIVISVWTVTNFISLQVMDLEGAIFWIRVVMGAVAAMFAALFLLADTFPREKIQSRRVVVSMVISWTILVVWLSQTSLVFKEAQLISGQITPVPGAAIPLFGLHVLTFLLGTLIVLFRKSRNSIGAVRGQTRIMLLGFSVTFFLSFVTTFLFTVVFKITQLVILGPVYSLILVGLIAYAIVKHRFLDIRLVVARSVAYTLLVVILGVIYAGGLFFGRQLFIQESMSISSLLISTLLALVIALSFQPLLRVLEKVTNGIFYKDRYDPNVLLGNLSHILASTLSLSDLAVSVLGQLTSQIKISSAYLELIKDNKVSWLKNVGEKERIEVDESNVVRLTEEAIRQPEHVLVFEELAESSVKDAMRVIGVSIVLPLMVESETIGVLLLGGKSSGDTYSVEDISLLKIIAPEVAVGVKNALSYEEIKAFNVTLQEEINKATQDLKNANEKLKELDKLKDEFVSLASHELRTPMTAIKGSISTILDGYAGDITKESREFLMAAYAENDRLIRLVNNLLNISRIESGRMTFTVTNFDLKKVITEVVGNLQMSATDKNLFLKFADCPDLPLVAADEDKVREVIINLVGNAIKFTHEGGVTVRAYVKDGNIEVAVEDTGHGIAAEDKELLFKKFSQVKSYTKQAGGTGLGLYICKQIIESMKGKVWFDSTVGRGSTFYFTLPISAV